MVTNHRRTVATIEARMTSSRLAGKVLMTAGDKPMLEILIERLQRVRQIDSIVVATTVNSTDDPIVRVAQGLGVGVFRGSEHDVLTRVCGALREAQADVCVEITGDCPLIDPAIVEEAITEFDRTRDTSWYISNSDPHRSVPAGMDVQVFGADTLFELETTTIDPEDREHVSYGFYRPEAGDRWRPRFITHDATRGAERLIVTLDYREDYELIRAIYEDLSPAIPDFGAADVIAWIRAHPEAHDRAMRARSAGV